MKTPQTPEVVATRKEADRLLALIPNKRYSDCDVEGKSAFNNHAAAMEAHRVAVHAARNLSA